MAINAGESRQKEVHASFVQEWRRTGVVRCKQHASMKTGAHTSTAVDTAQMHSNEQAPL